MFITLMKYILDYCELFFLKHMLIKQDNGKDEICKGMHVKE
jgi:hypothetical protein